MKIPCEIIRDLLPLYVDSACSEVSKKAVEEHLQDCKLCREELNLMSTDIQITQPQAAEEEPVKAAAAAWKRGKHKAFLKGGAIALVIAGLIAAILCHCLIPIDISPKSFQAGGVFQHRVFRWDMPEFMVRLLCGKKMEVDPITEMTSTDYNLLLRAREACVLNDERGNMAFYFDDDGLMVLEITFQNMKIENEEEWLTQLVEEFREYYGPETEIISRGSGIFECIWELENSKMTLSNGGSSSPFIFLFKNTKRN